MPFCGIVWSTIFCIPFWLIVILFIQARVTALEAVIFEGIALSVTVLFLVLFSPPKTERDKQYKLPSDPPPKERSFHREFKVADKWAIGAKTGLTIWAWPSYVRDPSASLEHLQNIRLDRPHADTVPYQLRIGTTGLDFCCSTITRDPIVRPCFIYGHVPPSGLYRKSIPSGRLESLTNARGQATKIGQVLTPLPKVILAHLLQ